MSSPRRWGRLVLCLACGLAAGCRNRTEDYCRPAWREFDEGNARIARQMQDDQAAGRGSDIPRSEALAAMADEATFMARCRALRPEAARCTNRAYEAAHTAECAPHADQVAHVHVR